MEALEPIIFKYFSYASVEEQQRIMEKLDEEYAKFEQDPDMEFDDISDENLLT